MVNLALLGAGGVGHYEAARDRGASAAPGANGNLKFGNFALKPEDRASAHSDLCVSCLSAVLQDLGTGAAHPRHARAQAGLSRPGCRNLRPRRGPAGAPCNLR